MSSLWDVSFQHAFGNCHFLIKTVFKYFSGKTYLLFFNFTGRLLNYNWFQATHTCVHSMYSNYNDFFDFLILKNPTTPWKITSWHSRIEMNISQSSVKPIIVHGIRYNIQTSPSKLLVQVRYKQKCSEITQATRRISLHCFFSKITEHGYQAVLARVLRLTGLITDFFPPGTPASMFARMEIIPEQKRVRIWTNLVAFPA